MSLVGSLEDLGLGDILQIIHLSRKSGILTLRSEHGEGQILFEQGLIRAAFLKDGPTDLRELVATRAAATRADLEAAARDARSRGVALGRVLVERGVVDEAALDALRHENVEGAVLRMFGFPSGEFSFEVREIDPAGEELFVSPGLNPQFLALEGTRRLDEDEDDADEMPVFDGESAAGAAEPEAAAVLEDEADAEGVAVAVAADPLAAEILEPAVEPDGADVPAPARERASAQAGAGADAPLPTPAAAAGPPPPLVAIDGQLPVLEWIKATLADVFPRVHIFQTSDLGISRLRQYLARRELPVVLIAADAPADPLSGARDCAEIVRRLKSLAPRMPVIVLHDRQAAAPRGAGVRAADCVPKPTLTDLADSRAVEARASCARALLLASARAAEAARARPARAGTGNPVARLKEVSARIRDPASRGELLAHVLGFAGHHFARVAMFMLRDDRAVGLAQVGLPRAGGPGDAGLREIEVPRDEPGWFRAVLRSRSPVRGEPTDAGDRRLAVLLGNAIPREAYVAPIESGGEVVALLYGDNLPGGEPFCDTAALEVVLHEAGLALDRAVLERTLEEAEA
jgi:hypothetical protein